MKNAALLKRIAPVGIALSLFAGGASANVVVDPKGHDPARLEQDRMECRALAADVDFNMASEHQGRAVLRGAAVAGGMAAIAGGNKEARRRSMGAGALAGGVMRNKSHRVDASVADAKRRDAERNCLVGRGYNPLS